MDRPSVVGVIFQKSKSPKREKKKMTYFEKRMADVSRVRGRLTHEASRFVQIIHTG